MKTNRGLVDYANKALKEKWGYVWGTFGLTLTETLLRQKIAQYPIQVGLYQILIRNRWLNKKTADCVGLIKSYIWYNDLSKKIIYNASTDLNANMMYDRSKRRGPIGTIPNIPGLAVYKKGHIGIYLGNGQVIESRSTSLGVIQSPL